MIRSLLFLLTITLLSCQSAKEPTEVLQAQILHLSDGTPLQYVIEGEGIPTLVIGSSIYYPRTFSTSLRDRLQMHFVDLKWFAPSYAEGALEKMNIASIVEEVEEIRKQLGLEKCLLIGHSIHGTIAMEYAKKHQQHLNGLVIIGSPSQWGNEVYNEQAAALWETADAERKQLQEENWGKVSELDRLTGQEEASARYNNMSPQYWYNPRYDAAWLWDDMTVHSELTTHLFTKVFQAYDMFDPAIPLFIPVWVGMGKYDYVIPYTLWEPQYEHLSNFNLTLFEKSGHTPQLEEPDAFNTALLTWLDQQL